MKLLWTYLKKYKHHILINLFCAVGFILIEVGIPTILAQGINNNFHGGDTKYILTLALQMLLCAVVGLLLMLMLAYSTDRATSQIVRDIRMDLFRHIQTFSRDEYEKFGISRLITNTGNDCFVILQFATLILKTGLIAPLMIISSFFLIFRESPKMAFMTLGAVPIMFLGIYFINRKTRPLSTKQQIGLDNINRNMRESLTGLRVVRAFNNEEYQEQRFKEVNQTYEKLSKLLFQKVAYISPIFTVVFCVIMITVIKLGSQYINSGMLAVGSLAAFIEYVFHALFSFLMLGSVLVMLPRFIVATNRISDVLATESSIPDNRQGGVSETDTQGVVEFKDVSFAYSDSSEEPVLQNITFTARPGETVAFIGSTGSGKSTLIRLIPRIFDVTSGSVLVDGVNVKDYNIDALRAKIGYVPQRAVLFSGTIRENLLFGNRGATQEELERAATIAQAKEFIDGRDNGYDEMLAEGGINLSGGQKQRLCIARAVVKNAPIFIFDDSFSALDYKTDAELRRQLKNELSDATVLIVAQRISTIKNADKILVINEGQVVGEGTHKELLETNQIYREIAHSQLTEEELAI